MNLEQQGPFGLSDADIERYARHLILPGFGGRGQRALLDARVVVRGDGHAAGEAVLFLVAAGVGRVVVGREVPASDVAQAQALNGTITVEIVDDAPGCGADDGDIAIAGDVRLDGALAAMAVVARMAGLGGWEQDGWRGREAMDAFCGRG